MAQNDVFIVIMTIERHTPVHLLLQHFDCVSVNETNRK